MGMKELWYYTGDLPRFQNAQKISSNLNFKDIKTERISRNLLKVILMVQIKTMPFNFCHFTKSSKDKPALVIRL